MSYPESAGEGKFHHVHMVSALFGHFFHESARMILDEIFKPNDIRGVFPLEVNEDLAFKIGYGLIATLGGETLAVGRDTRKSSLKLYNALAAGARAAGAEVIPLGQCMTEIVYFSAGMSYCDLGVMITASHNPPQYNGFKVVQKGNGFIAAKTDLAELREFIQNTSVSGGPEYATMPEPADYASRYIDYVADLNKLESNEKPTVVIDAGNGVAGAFWSSVAERLPVNVIPLNFEPDGDFPARGPDPYVRGSLDKLVATVKETSADIGLAFDGDGDRVAVVTAEGTILSGTDILAIIGGSILDRDPGEGTVACNLMVGRRAVDHLLSRGWQPYFVPVGHGSIKHSLRSDPNLLFVGESSGHFYYRLCFCADSTFLTSLILIGMAHELEQRGAALPAGWFRPEVPPVVPIPSYEAGLDYCRAAAAAFIQSERLTSGSYELYCEIGGRIIQTKDVALIRQAKGTRCDTPDGWFCLRPSGTEPIIRIAVECRSRDVARRWSRRLQEMVVEEKLSAGQE